MSHVEIHYFGQIHGFYLKFEKTKAILYNIITVKLHKNQQWSVVDPVVVYTRVTKMFIMCFLPSLDKKFQKKNRNSIFYTRNYFTETTIRRTQYIYDLDEDDQNKITK